MSVNQFLPFATGVGANVLSQSAYAANAQTTAGQQPGVASSALNNKALRQATYMVACLAQFLANTTGNDVLDDGNEAEVLATMALAWPGTAAPTVTRFTTTGTTAGYVFTVSSANATIGATYTNNGNTFTVLATIASGTLLFCSGTGSLSGTTLTKATGTGDSSITFSIDQALAAYTAKAGTTYLKVKMVGGGGGGGGSGPGTSTGTTGSNGGTTYFGSNLLICTGGQGGPDQNVGAVAAGGTPTVNSPAAEVSAFPGQNGGGSQVNISAAVSLGGSAGGNSPYFSGAGLFPNAFNGVSANALANTGSGGGGALANASAVWTGTSGSGGAGCEAIVPASSGQVFYYSVAGAGAGGGPGSSGFAGGNGSAGIIIIEEHYGS